MTFTTRKLPIAICFLPLVLLLATGPATIYFGAIAWPRMPFLIPMGLFVTIILAVGAYPAFYSLVYPNTLILDEGGLTLSMTGWTYRIKWTDIAVIGDICPGFFAPPVPQLLLHQSIPVRGFFGLKASSKRIPLPPFWKGASGKQLIALIREYHLRVAKPPFITYKCTL